MLTILYILGGIILLLLILAMLAPKTYDVSRSVAVEKPRKEVFEYLPRLLMANALKENCAFSNLGNLKLIVILRLKIQERVPQKLHGALRATINFLLVS